MVFWNILFTLAGCILIGFGAWSQLGARDYLNFLGENYVNTPIFIIIVGGVIFVVAFFGCCGAWKENKCMIYTYAVFLVLILIAQIGAGIAAYMLKGDLDTEVNKNMIDGMDNYGKEGYNGVTDTWDIVQKNLKCCGVEGKSDWFKHNITTADGFTPDSCCEGGQKEDCGEKEEAQKYSQGCYQLFREQFVDNIAIIGGVALGVAGVEFLVVLIACCLGKRMGADQFV
jgi:CD63 antigen